MNDKRNLPEAELARLADGSLPESRQAELRAQVQESAELQGALAEQQRAVAMLRAVDQPAPDALRARIDELTGVDDARAGAGAGASTRRRPRWRRAVVLPGVTALAVVVAIAVIVIGGGSSGPTVPQAAQLALASATLPAPGSDPAHPTTLDVHGAVIPFPTWGGSTGWTATGARSDTVHGRRVTTVFYTGPQGSQIGYAITSGPPLPGAHGRTVQRYNVRFTQQRQGGARVITWVRSGHTCVIAGRTVSYGTLVELASAGEQAQDE